MATANVSAPHSADDLGLIKFCASGIRNIVECDYGNADDAAPGKMPATFVTSAEPLSCFTTQPSSGSPCLPLSPSSQCVNPFGGEANHFSIPEQREHAPCGDLSPYIVAGTFANHCMGDLLSVCHGDTHQVHCAPFSGDSSAQEGIHNKSKHANFTTEILHGQSGEPHYSPGIEVNGELKSDQNLPAAQLSGLRNADASFALHNALIGADLCNALRSKIEDYEIVGRGTHEAGSMVNADKEECLLLSNSMELPATLMQANAHTEITSCDAALQNGPFVESSENITGVLNGGDGQRIKQRSGKREENPRKNQVMDGEDIKKQRARRNRESARRSRVKSKLHFQKMEDTYVRLRDENHALKNLIEGLLPSFAGSNSEVQARWKTIVGGDGGAQLDQERLRAS